MNKNTEIIEQVILIIRNQRVILDSDLAVLYGVETKNLNKAVKRNIGRFPKDFMFQLTNEDVKNCSRFQFGTLNRGKNIKYLPYAFTEHGALMAANVLSSQQAISMSVLIIRAFIKLRQTLSLNTELSQRIDELEKKYDEQFQIIFKVIQNLMEPPSRLPDEPQKIITGFRE